MSKRKGDLLWVTPPKAFGVLIILIVFGEIAYMLEFCTQGRYLEAILSATIGIGIFLILALDLLREILGSISDLKGVLEGQEKEDAEQSV